MLRARYVWSTTPRTLLQEGCPVSVCERGYDLSWAFSEPVDVRASRRRGKGGRTTASAYAYDILRVNAENARIQFRFLASLQVHFG